MDDEVDINADFYTFKNQLIDKFGAHYFKQAELFFERATAQAEQGLIHSAIADGKFALDLSNYSNDTEGIEFLIGFMAQLHCDLGRIKQARAYYNLGLQLLDDEAADYEDSREMYRRLKELIDSESWKGDIDEEK